MKKIYSIVALASVALAVNAQSPVRTTGPAAMPSQAHGTPGQVIHTGNPSVQAQGDTVFVFDGYYVYDWNATLPATFSLATEDLDGLTIASQVQSAFGTTGDYRFFYDIDPTSTLHYAHADSVFFAGATSWFNPAGQADNWLEMGPITIPATGGTLKWRLNVPDGNYRDGYKVLISTTGMTSNDFFNAPVYSEADMAPSTAGDTVNTPYTVFNQRSVDISSFAGQDIYIAFHHDATDMFILYLTDIMVTEGPLAVTAPEANNFALNQNVPNPANGTTMVTYNLNNNSDVEFTVSDVTGKVVYTENVANQAAGAHRVDINTSSFANGVYFYSMTVNGEKVTRKMTVSNN